MRKVGERRGDKPRQATTLLHFIHNRIRSFAYPINHTPSYSACPFVFCLDLSCVSRVKGAHESPTTPRTPSLFPARTCLLHPSCTLFLARDARRVSRRGGMLGSRRLNLASSVSRRPSSNSRPPHLSTSLISLGCHHLLPPSLPLRRLRAPWPLRRPHPITLGPIAASPGHHRLRPQDKAFRTSTHNTASTCAPTQGARDEREREREERKRGRESEREGERKR